MHNVERHSQATQVDIELVVEETSHITLTLRDNGTGFQPGNQNDGTGLDNMRERANLLNGRLVVTEHGKGTELILCLPLNEDGSV